jgi:hypothetical protein
MKDSIAIERAINIARVAKRKGYYIEGGEITDNINDISIMDKLTSAVIKISITSDNYNDIMTFINNFPEREIDDSDLINFEYITDIRDYILRNNIDIVYIMYQDDKLVMHIERDCGKIDLENAVITNLIPELEIEIEPDLSIGQIHNIIANNIVTFVEENHDKLIDGAENIENGDIVGICMKLTSNYKNKFDIIVYEDINYTVEE